MKTVLPVLLIATLSAGCSMRQDARQTPAYQNVESPLLLSGLNQLLNETREQSAGGDKHAQQQYGRWLVAVGQNLAAQPLLRNAAEQGDSQAQYLLGKVLLEHQPAEGRRWLEHSAELGNAEAAKVLSRQFSGEQSLLKDPQQAFKWLLYAAQLGDAQAQNDVGAAYSRGTGVTKNTGLALQWYLKSAMQGYALAQFNLAGAYQAGEGVKPQPALAYAWYQIASQTNRDANLEQIIEQMKLRMFATAVRNGDASKARLLVKKLQQQIAGSGIKDAT